VHRRLGDAGLLPEFLLGGRWIIPDQLEETLLCLAECPGLGIGVRVPGHGRWLLGLGGLSGRRSRIAVLGQDAIDEVRRGTRDLVRDGVE
jgi:hypothetical protein